MIHICGNVETITSHFDLENTKDNEGYAYTYIDGVYDALALLGFECGACRFEPMYQDWNGGKFDRVDHNHESGCTGLQCGDLIASDVLCVDDMDYVSQAGSEALLIELHTAHPNLAKRGRRVRRGHQQTATIKIGPRQSVFNRAA